MWVSPDSSYELREKAAHVAKVAHRDLPYDEYPYTLGDHIAQLRIHALIAMSEDTPVGLLVIEERQRVAQIQWEQASVAFHGTYEEDFHWTVSSIWVSCDHRRKGLAREMISEAASLLSVPMDSLSFLSPFTSEAVALLKTIFPKGVYVTF